MIPIYGNMVMNSVLMSTPRICNPLPSDRSKPKATAVIAMR